jgi:threonine dehydrogenase-like Zn-dependent dehydrogenase
VPDGVSDEQAVLADPCSVQLHAVLRNPPAAGPALVYGCGTLGLMTIALLRVLHPATPVWAVARHMHQAEHACDLGASEVLPADPERIVEAVAALAGTVPLRPWSGRPWLMRGPDVIYDTVGSPASIETGLRIASARGSLVVSGVEPPRRFEWTPYYFKEVSIVGSNAFAMETIDGRRMHAMEAYLELLTRGFDLSHLVSHRYALADYRRAFLRMHSKAGDSVVKSVFAFP